MSAEKSLALVMRVVDFSESSCVVTLFTRDFGKIGALAKGARRRHSACQGALDVLSLCRIVFLHKSADALDLLTEAKLERRFRAARTDLRRLYAGYYVVELLGGFTDDYDPNPAIFDLTNETLLAVDQNGELARYLLRFELSLLRLTGQCPSFDRCVSCGGAVSSQGRVALAMLAGGVVCDNCRTGQRKVVRLSRPAIETLQRFSEPDDPYWRTDGVPESVHGEIRAVINHYLAHQLGRPSRLRSYVTGIV